MQKAIKNTKIVAVSSIFLLMIFSLPFSSLAQEGTDLRSEEVKIRGEFVPEVRSSVKISETPTIVDSTEKIQNISYSEIDKRVDTYFEAEPLPAAKMKGEPLNKLYRAYIKGGFGNYRSPLGEIHLNTLRSRQYTAGISLKHWSTAGFVRDMPYSAFNDNEAKIYGKYFLANHTIGGSLDYNYNALNYYGVSQPENFILNDKKDIFQNYHTAGGKFEFKSRYKEIYKLQYDTEVDYYYMQSFEGASENKVGAKLDFNRRVGSEIYAINTNTEYYLNNNTVENLQNYIVTINPEVRLQGDELWDLKAGINVVVSGVHNQVADIDFFPNVKFRYNLIKEILIPYINVGGGIDRNSLRSTIQQNPFINPLLSLENTKRNVDADLGLRGSLSKNISYNIGVNYQKITNAAFFANDTSGQNILQNKFELIYDNMEMFNGYAELGMEVGERFRFLSRLDYYNYTMENFAEAWHLPQFKGTISTAYNLRDKIIAKADLYYIGERKAFNHFQDGDISQPGIYPTNLKGFFDANLNLEYRYTSKFSLFLNINNIAASRYNMWYNYPSQAINAIGGVTFIL